MTNGETMTAKEIIYDFVPNIHESGVEDIEDAMKEYAKYKCKEKHSIMMKIANDNEGSGTLLDRLDESPEPEFE